MIAAAFSGRSILYARDLESTRALAEYQARIRKHLKPNPGENTDARCAFAILAALEPAASMAKRDLARRIHSDRFGPSAFERALGSLEAVGELHVDRAKPARVRRVGA